MITLFIHKSNRKNSKCEMINIVKYHNNNDSVIETIVSVVDKIITINNNYNTRVPFISWGMNKFGGRLLSSNKCGYYSIEQVINLVYTLIDFSDNTHGLTLNELYLNPSIKHLINKHYNQEVA